MTSSLVHRWMGFGVMKPEAPSLKTRLMAWVDIGRPLISLMIPFSVAGPAAVANGGWPSPWLCAVGVLAVLLVGWGIHPINDWVHHEQDRHHWPGRPIPSGRMRRTEALAIALVCYGGALALAWLFFNEASKANFVILAIGCVAGWGYAAFTRDRIGYLSLPLLIGLFDLGGWAAFSPETLFTSATPWLLFALAVAWQGAHIMVLSAAFKGGPSADAQTVMPALFYKPTVKGATALALGFSLLFWPAAIVLYFRTDLGLLYLLPTLAAAGYATWSVWRFYRSPMDRALGTRAFNRLTLLRIAYPAAILAHYLVFQGSA